MRLAANILRYALAAFVWTLALLSVASCAHPASSTLTPAPTHHTAQGVPVVAPSWLSRDPALLADALDEIDRAGVPEGWTVAIRLPKWADESAPSGLVRGLCVRERKVIEVGFRFWPLEDRPLMPALVHEVDHAAGRIDDEEPPPPSDNRTSIAARRNGCTGSNPDTQRRRAWRSTATHSRPTPP